MRIILDTNVILDALLDRDPWANDAKAIWMAHADGRISAHLTASSLTDIFYISRRLTDRARAWQAVRACLDQLFVLGVGHAELEAAATSGEGDFEDNVQIACAQLAGVDFIVTRDPSGFIGSPVPVVAPSDFLATLGSS